MYEHQASINIEMLNGDEFIVRYGSANAEVNADTFIYSLLGITAIVQEVNLTIGTGEPAGLGLRLNDLEATKSILN